MAIQKNQVFSLPQIPEDYSVRNKLFKMKKKWKKFFKNLTQINKILGNSGSFLNKNNNNQKGFENSDDEGSDFSDPEQEIEIKGNNASKKTEIQIEVNEKALKLPISEFFVYDFKAKKYTNIGKGDFTIEYDKIRNIIINNLI